MPAPNKKNKHIQDVIRLHFDEGMTLRAIGESLGIHEVTLSKWLRSEGLSPNQRGYKQNQTVRAAKAEETKEERACRRCGVVFEDYAYRNRAFCSRECTNEWQRENATGTRFRRWCPCGKEIENNPYQNKHCSPECRVQHGKKKQANPANYVTFNCQNCDKSVTRYKSYGKGHNKYCSNACANKHTKVKKHYGVEGLEIVFDSSYEVLFWGLCTFLKVPVERFEREHGVEWREGAWYAPDFYLPTLNMAVEMKGAQDEEDAERWDTFCAKGAMHLRVLLQQDLTVLIGLGSTREKLIEYLKTGGASLSS